MKKQRFFMLGIITVLVAVLSLTFVSSTFAKYTSSKNGNDTARVAKWGVKIAVDGTAFATTYNDNKVLSSSTDKVVAPGTSKNLTNIQITGTPEVAVEVSFEATLTLAGWEIGSGEYCPLVFIIDGADYKKADNETVAEFAGRVEAVIEAYSAQYAANTDLSNLSTPTVSWRWDFSTGEANDAKDSELGDLAAEDDAPTITLDLAVVINQVQ